MSTSDKSLSGSRYLSAVGAYLLVSVCCALFGAVYERFSHGVYAYAMIYAFAFPLLLGAIPFFLLLKAGKPFPGKSAANLVHAGIAALTVGSVLQGALEIYGTSNPLTAVYWLVGGVLSMTGWASVIIRVYANKAHS